MENVNKNIPMPQYCKTAVSVSVMSEIQISDEELLKLGFKKLEMMKNIGFNLKSGTKVR
jgi:hypothetical protein